MTNEAVSKVKLQYMSSSKRLVFLFALVAINSIFTIKEISLATPDADPSVVAVGSTGATMLEGALVANLAMPQTAYAKEPPAKAVAVAKFMATGYSSTVDQTDDTPFITASGSNVRFGVAASNILPFGTKFRVPKIFGNQIFTIEDRMSPRYNGQKIVDIWFENHEQAKQFGKKLVQMEIL
ncbi:MAG: hypothetical protein QMD86_01390 [Patescibacteria group bacterium]|nr:hypothetical protein [Patescibacteria group bacterium]